MIPPEVLLRIPPRNTSWSPYDVPFVMIREAPAMILREFHHGCFFFRDFENSPRSSFTGLFKSFIWDSLEDSSVYEPRVASPILHPHGVHFGIRISQIPPEGDRFLR